MIAFYFFFYPLHFFPFGTKAKLRTGGTRSEDFGLRRLKNPFRQNEEWRTYRHTPYVLLCVLRSTKLKVTLCVSVISPLRIYGNGLRPSVCAPFTRYASRKGFCRICIFDYCKFPKVLAHFRNLVGGYTPLQPLCSHSRCQTSLTSEMTCIIHEIRVKKYIKVV